MTDKYWIKDLGNGKIAVGLTPEFCKQLGIVWNFMAKTGPLKQNKPFANLESSKCLGPLLSPVSGEVAGWNSEFVEYPEKINSTEPLLYVKVST